MGTIKRTMLLVAVVLATPFVAVACDSTNDNPKPPTFTTSASSSSSGQGGAGGAGGNGGEAGAAGAGGSPNCAGPNGCYACPPKETDQYLNACTDSQCSPFDNVTRLPLYNGGNLPPLP